MWFTVTFEVDDHHESVHGGQLDMSIIPIQKPIIIIINKTYFIIAKNNLVSPHSIRAGQPEIYEEANNCRDGIFFTN